MREVLGQVDLACALKTEPRPDSPSISRPTRSTTRLRAPSAPNNVVASNSEVTVGLAVVDDDIDAVIVGSEADELVLHADVRDSLAAHRVE